MKVSELKLFLILQVEKSRGIELQPCGAPVIIQILLQRNTINFCTCSCQNIASCVFFFPPKKTHRSTFTSVFRNACVNSPLIAQRPSVGYLCSLTSVTFISSHSFRARAHGCLIAERYHTGKTKRPICLWGNIYSDKECVCALRASDNEWKAA